MKVKIVDYKKSYRNIKRRVKNYVLENASIVDEVCLLQKELACARSERLALIEKLMFYEGLEKNAVGQGQYSTEEHENIKKNIVHDQNAISDKTNDNTIKENVYFHQRTFPLKLNNILVHSIGEIITVNPNFHSTHWIYPVGYVATRIYAHPRDPRKKCVFTCKILNNAGIPQFQLIPDNDLDGVFFGETASKCHQELLKCIQESTHDSIKVELRPKGEEFFGLSHPKVQSLLLSDARIKHCTKFKGYIVLDTEEPSECKDPTLSFADLQSVIR